MHLVNLDPPGYSGDPLTDTWLPVPGKPISLLTSSTDKLKLNLKVYRAAESAAWQEARYGKLWEQGVEGIEKYNEINQG